MAALRVELRELGVFRGDRAGYIARSITVLTLTALAWWGFVAVDRETLRGLLAIMAGYAGVQAAAIGHEAGHGAVSRSRAWTRLTGQFFMTLVVGASFTQWTERHGAHHIHPNSGRDPDVRPGLFRFNKADAQRATGLSGWCTQHQHLLLPPLSTLMGFSLKYAGWRSVLRAPRAKAPDLLLLLAHTAFWILLPAHSIGIGPALLNYGLLTWVEGAYLAFVFLPNHVGGPTGEEASHWPPALRQIVAARNLPSHRWLTHLCIGLNTHIEHHLFGHLPPSRLREARGSTRRLCRAHGIPYRECGLFQAFAEVHTHNMRMAGVAREAARQRAALQRT